MSRPVAIAHALYAAIESGRHGADLADLFTPDAETIEHPNLLKPTGARTPLAHMLAASTAGFGLLARQHYEVLAADEAGDLAILRLRWTGTMAKSIGPFTAGQELTAHVAQFVTTRDGRIARIETFDCYEPFDRPTAA